LNAQDLRARGSSQAASDFGLDGGSGGGLESSGGADELEGSDANESNPFDRAAAQTTKKGQAKSDNKIPNPFDLPSGMGAGMGVGMGEGMMMGEMGLGADGAYGGEMMDESMEMGMGMGMGEAGGMMGMAETTKQAQDRMFRAGLQRAITALKQAKGEKQREVLLGYVREAMENRYDKIIIDRKNELARIKARVEKLESDLKRRVSAKQRVVNIQLQSVQLASEGLLELDGR
jgi:hypothetical protein